jgi:DNA-binding SARP family transcriptional activator/tetratricopeptide (TPR) repeat protein
VQFRILGPVDIRTDDGDVLTLRRRQERLLLGVLLLEAGRAVSATRLSELLWENEPPQHARQTVRTYVTRIRSLLAESGAARRGVALISERGGYRLRVDQAYVDVHQFRVLLDRAAGRTDPTARDRLLRAALDLWRGPALAQAASDRQRDALCTELEELRLQAVEASLTTGLELGRHRELLPQLTRWCAEYPDRERFVELQMIALYRDGRTREALDTYSRVRTRLATQYGLDPGPRLRQLHQAVLCGDAVLMPAGFAPSGGPAAAVVRPAQLPPDVSVFTGRSAELRKLDALLTPGERTTAVVVSAIAGTPGVGKTALAVHWAHRVRESFVDGQLYVDLRGYGPGPPVRPLDALTGFLQTLGKPQEQLPTEMDVASAMYRTLLAGKQMLVVLDNANHPDHVRPLLPASPDCLVLITSRDALTGLSAVDGARQITLDVLTEFEACDLLTKVIGEARAAAEPEEVQALARICAYLPLALRIAAASLVSRPRRSIADYVRELSEANRIAYLEVEGDPKASLRVAFDSSYSTLPRDAQRMFRLLGLLPGTDVSADAAAALAGISPDLAAAALDIIAEASLINRAGPRRYTFHDLLRQYSAEYAETETVAIRASAQARLYGFYLGAARAADALLFPNRRHLPTPETPIPDEAAWTFTEENLALAWLDDERANLIAAVVHGAVHGPRQASWLLADMLRPYFSTHGYPGEGIDVAQAALQAAESEGELLPQGYAHMALARLYLQRGQNSQSIEHLTRILDVAHQTQWHEGLSIALGDLATAHLLQGEPQKAVEYLSEALDVDRRLGWRVGLAVDLQTLALVNWQLGKLNQAAECHLEVLAMLDGLERPDIEAIAYGNLAEVYQFQGRIGDARQHLERALELTRALGDRSTETDYLRIQAGILRDEGRLQQARECADMALALSRETGMELYEINILNLLGSLHDDLAKYDAAIGYHRDALQRASDGGNWHSAAEAMIGLATAHCHSGQYDQAQTWTQRAITATRSRYRLLEAQSHRINAEILLGLGRSQEASNEAREALSLYRETGYRQRELDTLAQQVAIATSGEDADADRPPSS